MLSPDERKIMRLIKDIKESLQLNTSGINLFICNIDEILNKKMYLSKSVYKAILKTNRALAKNQYKIIDFSKLIII